MTGFVAVSRQRKRIESDARECLGTKPVLETTESLCEGQLLPGGAALDFCQRLFDLLLLSLL
jgi:hypothetical protein